MKSEAQKKELDEWVHKADDDLTSANALLETDFFPETIICFLFQQAVEKYLKAFLISSNIDIEKTHNIELLQKMCSEVNNDFADFDFKNLTDFAVKFRYPTDLPLPTKAEVLYFKNVIIELKKVIQDLI